MTTKFTKSHYEIIAAVLKARVEPVLNAQGGDLPAAEGIRLKAREHELRNVAKDLSVVFENDSDKFQYGLFMRACGFPLPMTASVPLSAFNNRHED